MKKGFALISTLVIITTTLVLGTLLARLAFNYQQSFKALYCQEQAFFVAEAGLEKAKVEVNNNLNWFTDLPHTPIDDINWLVNDANGQLAKLNLGKFKLVREQGQARIYSVGFVKQSIVVLKLTFQPAPYKTSGWQQL